jgi:prepilin-type processing-associated H-X9-DG protein
MRNLGQALFAYSSDFGGSLPFAFYTANNVTGSGVSSVGDGSDNPADENIYVWWSVLRKYVLPGVPNIGYDNRVPSQAARSMKVFACPEGFNVDAGCDFSVNPSLMPDRRYEVIANNARNWQLLKAATVKQLTADVVLMWDATEIPPNFNAQFVTGYHVDNAQFADATFLQAGSYVRFRGFAPDGDPLGDDSPIDPGANKLANEPNSAGNIRWRHGRDDTANFLWGDGSVRSAKLIPLNRTPQLDPSINPFGGSEILRRNLRPKPPAGWRP